MKRESALHAEDRIPAAVQIGEAPVGPLPASQFDGRTALLCLLSIGIAITASLAAQALTRLIWLVTHIAFFGRIAVSAISPKDNLLGLMAATFGSPVSAVLLAVELLPFEFRARSLIPIALASATASGIRLAFIGAAPIFAMLTSPLPVDWR